MKVQNHHTIAEKLGDGPQHALMISCFVEQFRFNSNSWEAPPEEGKLLQYREDLLIATKTEEVCVAWTVSLLNFLGL